ncbi:MAG: efflux RND transporter periplasmic adaptor subunit, partial [Planctomycetota bacterium]|nr:efflux RND transporter periplasmic adaptor subunit [Planctomycetota bacterium]
SELAQIRDRIETANKNLKLEQEQFTKLKGMLDDCTIEAEASGLIVYARRRGWDKEEPIKLGRRVYERERLLLIPDLESMEVEFNIHESSVKRVAEGQQVWITVDALPGERFSGRVNRVALVPSSKSSWMNPDLKVYEADVKFDHMVDGIRPGMHAQVEILVANYESELLVPVECVFQSGARSFVYMETGPDGSLQEIQVGANNQRFVRVVSGLAEGDRIYLSAPEGAPPVPGPEPRPFLPPVDIAAENGG